MQSARAARSDSTAPYWHPEHAGGRDSSCFPMARLYSAGWDGEIEHGFDFPTPRPVRPTQPFKASYTLPTISLPGVRVLLPGFHLAGQASVGFLAR